MKNIYLFILILIIISCKEDVCDTKFQLNEFGGYGRNEVTFLVDGNTVWHSSEIEKRRSGSSSFLFKVENPYFFHIRKSKEKIRGRIVKDSLGQDVFSDYYEVELETVNSSECESHKFHNFTFDFKFIGFNDKIDTIIDSEIDMYYIFNDETKTGYSNYYSYSDFKANIYLNRKDSIIYGSFEGTLYVYEGLGFKKTKIDSIKITKGTFDYKYDYRHIKEFY